MLFTNNHLLVRNLELKDSHLLAKWLSDPAVLEYYEGRDNPFDLKKSIKNFPAEKTKYTAASLNITKLKLDTSNIIS